MKRLLKNFRSYQVFRVDTTPDVSGDSDRASLVKELLAKNIELNKLYSTTKNKDKKAAWQREGQRIKDHIKKMCAKVPVTTRYLFVHKKTKVEWETAKLSLSTKKTFDSMVRRFRRDRNECENRNFRRAHEIPDYGVISLLANTHTASGTIYEVYVQKKIGQLSHPKKPTDNRSHYVGIELEFTSKVERTQLGLKLFKAGLVDYCELKDDGSLRPKKEEHGYEIAALFKESNFSKYLKKLCLVLEDVKAEVEGRRCGLHVHIDVRRRKKDVVYHNLVSCQSLFMKMVPEPRRNNEFCLTVNSKKFPTKFTGGRHERYKAINASAFYRHSTLEVRLHEGSVDFKDIRNWVSLLIKIASYRIKLSKSVRNVNVLQKSIKLGDTLTTHIQDRINKWNIMFPRSPRAPWERPQRTLSDIARELTARVEMPPSSVQFTSNAQYIGDVAVINANYALGPEPQATTRTGVSIIFDEANEGEENV